MSRSNSPELRKKRSKSPDLKKKRRDRDRSRSPKESSIKKYERYDRSSEYRTRKKDRESPDRERKRDQESFDRDRKKDRKRPDHDVKRDQESPDRVRTKDRESPDRDGKREQESPPRVRKGDREISNRDRKKDRETPDRYGKRNQESPDPVRKRDREIYDRDRKKGQESPDRVRKRDREISARDRKKYQESPDLDGKRDQESPDRVRKRDREISARDRKKYQESPDLDGKRDQESPDRVKKRDREISARDGKKYQVSPDLDGKRDQESPDRVRKRDREISARDRKKDRESPDLDGKRDQESPDRVRKRDREISARDRKKDRESPDLDMKRDREISDRDRKRYRHDDINSRKDDQHSNEKKNPESTDRDKKRDRDNPGRDGKQDQNSPDRVRKRDREISDRDRKKDSESPDRDRKKDRETPDHNGKKDRESSDSDGKTDQESHDRDRKRVRESPDRERKRYRHDDVNSRKDDQPSKRYWDYSEKEKDKGRQKERDSYRNKDRNYEIGTRYYEPNSTKGKVNIKAENDESKRGSESSGPKPPPIRPKKENDLLTTKTGGAYIPPAKLRMMQAQITDKSSAAYQRIAWEALKKSIHGHINKINTGNIATIIKELLKENIVRGRGLLSRSIIQAQAASPTFTHVYAALVAAINSRFPNIGELLLKRLVIQFKRGFKRNVKATCLTATSFIAHLVNQKVAHEILALEILTLLVETPTDDSVEVAISFLKECGQKLTEVSSKGTNAIFEMLRNILHEGQLDKRVQYMIEVIFQVRKDGFKDHVAVIEELELVSEEDQFTHLIMLDDATDGQDILNVFKLDANYQVNEEKYKELSKELLGSDGESGSDEESGSGEESDDEDDEENTEEKKDGVIVDNTETNLIALRRTIYLTIHSSLDFEECAHKLMKMELKPGQEMELCHMFLDCCAEQRTYEKFYGLLSQRFCQINRIYIGPFEEIFKASYGTAHRLDTNRLRNISKFFAHLLFTDAISWEVLDCVKLNEEDTTSSSRIFIKILFQELAEYMGLTKLNNRLKDPTLQDAFSGIFPRDNPKNTRFAINFFTSIGLGGLTDELREHLKQAPKTAPIQENLSKPDSSGTGSSSSSSSSESSSDSSSSSSSSSDEESDSSADKRKKKRVKKR